MNSQPARILMAATLTSDRTFKESSFGSDKWDNPFHQSLYSAPNIPKNLTAKSKAASKPSFSSTGSSSRLNKTIDNIRNSSFLGSSPSQQNRQIKFTRPPSDIQGMPFVPLSINSSGRFQQAQIKTERRKSQNFYIKNHNCPVAPRDDSSELKSLVDLLTVRVGRTEEEIVRLKEREKEKKMQVIQGDLKQFRGKLLQLAKFNSKHFTEHDYKLQELYRLLQESQVRQDQLKKVNVLEAKLHQLYQGFKIKEGHNEAQITKGIRELQVRIKECIHTEITNLATKIDQQAQEMTVTNTKLQQIQNKLKESFPINLSNLQKSNKKSNTCKYLQSKQLLLFKEGEALREKPKSRFNASPKKWIYDTPTKQNVDTPIKCLNFDQFVADTSQLVMRQQTYYIDRQGYLLDEDMYYLLDDKNQQILLPTALLACLRENHLLSTQN